MLHRLLLIAAGTDPTLTAMPQKASAQANCACVLAATLTCLFAPALSHAQNAYITNAGDGTVSVINTVTNTVSATIPIGANAAGVAVTPDGSRVYVTNQLAGAVSVINTASNTVIANIPVGTNPIGVAVTPDSSKVYVANAGANAVSVIDTASNIVIATVPVSISPAGLAVTPDGKKVYVTSYQATFMVSVIDTAINTVTATISVACGFCYALGVAITPDGSTVYIGNNGINTVSVISTVTNMVVANVVVGTSPVGLAITPDGSKVYVGNAFSSDVVVIATANNTVTAAIPVGGSEGVSVTPDGSKVYVAIPSGGVSVIDTATNTVSGSPITVGANPEAFGAFIGPRPCVTQSGAGRTYALVGGGTQTVNGDINGQTITVTGNGTLALGHDANGAHIVVNSPCVTVNLAHDFNNGVFTDQSTPSGKNYVLIAGSSNGATFNGGSEGPGGVFTIGHDAGGASFTFASH
jgi:YVTN family beta-propeller protein